LYVSSGIGLRPNGIKWIEKKYVRGGPGDGTRPMGGVQGDTPFEEFSEKELGMVLRVGDRT